MKEEKVMINLTSLIEMLSMIILIVGMLAFAVSLIVQVIKGVSIFAKLPTDLLVFILSIVLTVITFIAYAQYISIVIVWYMIVAAIFVGFVVAAVSMFGWTKVVEIASRYIKDRPTGNM